MYIQIRRDSYNTLVNVVYLPIYTDGLHENSHETFEIPCNCPKPCNQTIYEPTLSSAALSVLSVDNILSNSREIVQTKYHKALEVRDTSVSKFNQLVTAK